MRIPGLALALLVPASLGAAAGVPADVAGRWKGRVAVEGDTLVTVLDLDRVGGRWLGECDVPQYGVQDMPVGVVVTDSGVVLQFTGIDLDFHGAPAGGGESLAGSIGPQPVVFARVGPAGLSLELLALEAAAEQAPRPHRLGAGATELRRSFEADAASPRLLLLLSPT